MIKLRTLFLSIILTVPLSGCFDDTVGKAYNDCFNRAVAQTWNTALPHTAPPVKYSLSAKKSRYLVGDSFILTATYENLSNTIQIVDVFMGASLPNMTTLAFVNFNQQVQFGTIANPATWINYNQLVLLAGQIITGSFSTTVQANWPKGDYYAIGGVARPAAFNDGQWNQGDAIELDSDQFQIQ